jgi:hypothetical protein
MVILELLKGSVPIMCKQLDDHIGLVHDEQQIAHYTMNRAFTSSRVQKKCPNSIRQVKLRSKSCESTVSPSAREVPVELIYT